jgi:hypothetical protein
VEDSIICTEYDPSAKFTNLTALTGKAEVRFELSEFMQGRYGFKQFKLLHYRPINPSLQKIGLYSHLGDGVMQIEMLLVWGPWILQWVLGQLPLLQLSIAKPISLFILLPCNLMFIWSSIRNQGFKSHWRRHTILIVLTLWFRIFIANSSFFSYTYQYAFKLGAVLIWKKGLDLHREALMITKKQKQIIESIACGMLATSISYTNIYIAMTKHAAVFNSTLLLNLSKTVCIIWEIILLKVFLHYSDPVVQPVRSFVQDLKRSDLIQNLIGSSAIVTLMELANGLH